MKIIKSKFVLLLTLLMLITNNAYAGNLKGWADLMTSYIDQPLINTLSGMYRNQGMVLLDIGRNYAAYSFRAENLTDSQKENISSVENVTGFVLSFGTCEPNTNLTENINYIAVKRSFNEIPAFIENLYELIELADEKQWIKKIYGKSSEVENQIIMLWAENDTPNNDTFVKIQINKEIHQLVWQMTKKCPQ